VGGRDGELRQRLHKHLSTAGFVVQIHANPQLQGTHPENVCNRGTNHAGAQLEISRGLRDAMFSGMKREEREITTPVFERFISAVRAALSDRETPTVS